MKAITIKKIAVLITGLFLLNACDEEDKDKFDDFGDTGIINNIEIADGAQTFIDVVGIGNGESTTLQFTANTFFGSPVESDVIAIYRKAAILGKDDEIIEPAAVYSATVLENVTLPNTFTITTDDIVNAFNELTILTDIKFRDELSLAVSSTRSDGLVFDIFNPDGSLNIKADIINDDDFNTFISFPVSCPSGLAGDYVATITESSDPLGDFVTTKDVTISEVSSGRFNISDATGEVLELEVVMQFTDQCEIITVVEPSISFPTQVIFTDRGSSINADTGVLTFNLAFKSGSCCRVGTTFTLTLTPK
ncbi:hypothetical protein [Aquimarina agarivorans]|uniref:hypothetical protein n=1 Tax=Aquimarina agarivorans TaxID=980584 RepID=UPI000248ED00|nr:hypothetical protein [Aquimarina agarivorans]